MYTSQTFGKDFIEDLEVAICRDDVVRYHATKTRSTITWLEQLAGNLPAKERQEALELVQSARNMTRLAVQNGNSGKGRAYVRESSLAVSKAAGYLQEVLR